jgi:A/G-specific adenine glycosylase
VLLRWYDGNRRDLPWRGTSDPYAIWLSEVMLQQTAVTVVAPRWKRFLRRFPTVAALARASSHTVLAEWSGLGYYSRARNLHRAARAIIAGGGVFPQTIASLRRLPGVGAYTAAAVGSIAFGLPEAVVDGNVARVLSRLFARRAGTTSVKDRAELASRARDLLSVRHPGDHNQAMMELGATICLPQAPRCGVCPLARLCQAARHGRPEDFPLAPKRAAPRKLRLAAGLAWRGGRLVLVPDRTLVRGHFLTPLASVPEGQDAAEALQRVWRTQAGRRVLRLTALGTLRHAVLERRYEVEVFRVAEALAPSTHGELEPVTLIPRAALGEIPRGGLLEKIVRLWEAGRRPPAARR